MNQTVVVVETQAVAENATDLAAEHVMPLADISVAADVKLDA